MEKTSFLKPTLCVVAGHSGGHILPALTLAQTWQRTNPKGQCLFFSTDKKLDKHILHDNKKYIIHIPLTFHSISLKKCWQFPTFVWSFIRSCTQSYQSLSQYKIEKVITTGGYVSLPVCITAKLLGIPIEVYELNAVPGKAIRILSYIAKKIYICFPQTEKYFIYKNCIVAAYPLQPSLQKQPSTKKITRISLGLKPSYTTILILGGSQGSLFINNLIKIWLTHASKAYQTIQIIHQTGTIDTTNWNKIYTSYKIPACVFPYYDTMHQLYCATDIIINRSGAGSLFEAVHYKKPCITIPLKSGTSNHQIANALALAKCYPTLVYPLKQQELEQNASLLNDKLHALITNL